MSEVLGDLRGRSDVSVSLAQTTLNSLGYVVVADSQQVALEPGFRTGVLPQYEKLLKEDIYAVPPAGRRRVSGLVKYERRADGSLELIQDYAKVAIPVWSGSGFTERRVYPDGLPILKFPAARRWLEGLGLIASPKLQESKGTMFVHYFETGHSGGKVVSGPHQDGELLVASFPDYIHGEGAATTLYRPATPSFGDVERPSLERIATFELGVGDVALSDDVGLWHDVSPLRPPADRSSPRRRSLIVVFHTPRTYQWLQDCYDSGRLSSASAS